MTIFDELTVNWCNTIEGGKMYVIHTKFCVPFFRLAWTKLLDILQWIITDFLANDQQMWNDAQPLVHERDQLAVRIDNPDQHADTQQVQTDRTRLALLDQQL